MRLNLLSMSRPFTGPLLNDHGLDRLPLVPSITESTFGRTVFTDAHLRSARIEFLAKADGVLSAKKAGVLFEKIVTGTRCLDPVTCHHAIRSLAAAVQAFIGDEPYVVVQYKANRSEAFLLQCLLQTGLIRPPTKTLVVWREGGRIAPHICEELRVHRIKCVIMDDMGYSGYSLHHAVHALDSVDCSSQIFIGVLGISDKAMRRTHDVEHRYAAFRIPRWDEGFTAADVAALIAMYGTVISDPDRIWTQEVGYMTFPWYKCPDILAPLIYHSGILSALSSYDEHYPMLHPDYPTVLRRMTPGREMAY